MSIVTSPFVTIILPFHNAERTLKRSVHSILTQDYTNFELLLINNNSDDKSTNSISEYLKDKRTKMINESKKGVVSAHRAGVNQAQGIYHIRMDADDIALPDRVSKQVNFLEKNHHYEACGSLVNFSSSLDYHEGLENYVSWSNSLLDSSSIYLNRFIEMPLINPSMCIRASYVKKYGTYVQSEFPEDYDYWLSLMNKGYKIGKVPEPLITWHDHEHRLTRKDNRYNQEAFFKCKANYLSQDLLKRNIHEVLVWGAGKRARQYAKYLIDFNLKVKGYVDISSSKIGQYYDGIKVHAYSEIDLLRKTFVLSYIGKYEIRKKIAIYLNSIGLAPGKNYYLCA
ncbi:MAG: glycosyltransferase family 2 protein [Lentisphaeria bacterium]|nr:glycosyltransferase family 2 protein [Lentisphaeria bacterium]